MQESLLAFPVLYQFTHSSQVPMGFLPMIISLPLTVGGCDKFMRPSGTNVRDNLKK
jgi:hypothetical protein